MQQQNYYELFGIPRQATTAEIKAAYRRKMQKYHPDKLQAELAECLRSGDRIEIARIERELEQAATVAQDLNEAYAVLSNVVKRRQYDDKIRRTQAPRPSTTKTSYQPRPHAYRPSNKKYQPPPRTTYRRPPEPPRSTNSEIDSLWEDGSLVIGLLVLAFILMMGVALVISLGTSTM